MMKPKPRNAPKIIYKYLDPAGFIALTSLTMRFTKLVELNDPFESRLSLMSKGQFITPPKRRPQLEKLLREHGVSCFTEDARHLLLWAHYARSHRGFVIGFNTDHPSFQSYGSLVQMNYSTRRPRIDSQNFDGVLHALSFKSKEWKYEREWRIVTPLDACEKSCELFLKPINPGSISELTLGVDADDGLIDRAIEWQRSHQHVKLRRSRLDSLKYELYLDEELHHEPSLVISKKDPRKPPHLQVNMGDDFSVGIVSFRPGGLLYHDFTAEVVQEAIEMTQKEKRKKGKENK